MLAAKAENMSGPEVLPRELKAILALRTARLSCKFHRHGVCSLHKALGNNKRLMTQGETNEEEDAKKARARERDAARPRRRRHADRRRRTIGALGLLYGRDPMHVRCCLLHPGA